MKKTIAVLLSVFVLILGVAPSVQAASSAEIKARMAQRLGQVVTLKNRGAVGENNQGYLSARGKLSSAETSLMNAENADRRAVYAMIAKKAGSSPASVGKTRAASIRKSAPRGTWVQMGDGSWKKK